MDRNGHVSVIIEYEKPVHKETQIVDNYTDSEEKLPENETPRKLLITINDDGIDMDPETVSKLNHSLEEKRTEDDGKGAGSIGLYNIQQRIHLYYGGDYGITVRSNEGKGTSVVLTLPADGLGIEQRKGE